MQYLNVLSEAIQKSEDDKQRSLSVFELISELGIVRGNGHTPKNIIQFWDEKENIPEDVQECMDSWKKLGEIDFYYQNFSQKTALEYISTNLTDSHVKAFNNCYHPAMKSDYFRLCYIYCSGGMYVDCDEVYSGQCIDNYFEDSALKLNPLCYDLKTDTMIPYEEFIGRPIRKSCIYYFNNNPLIAGPRNPIIGYALNRATGILTTLNNDDLPEIQSTAGPGNITASVIFSYYHNKNLNVFRVLMDWERISNNVWSLSYRNDKRNWRLSNRVRFDSIKVQGNE
ncbi:hypothetical protein L7C23_003422 [Salmonella enterica]|nr:hypothetical protein [Salmonella enterica subsp. enterica serovar Stuttgart]ECG2579302.1 hypothetical protein [Salmonella enterica subsp. enterica]EIV0973322.1 hypothetical protein [Salmonella enterica]